MAFDNLSDALVRDVVEATSGAGFDANQQKAFLHLADVLVAAVALPLATPTVVGGVRQTATQAPAAAADVAALKTQFDALLTKLKASGQMAS